MATSSSTIMYLSTPTPPPLVHSTGFQGYNYYIIPVYNPNANNRECVTLTILGTIFEEFT